jgi:hypothetical protein
LQPYLRRVGEFDRLKRLPPGACRLVMQIEAARCGIPVRPDPRQLAADTRLGVGRQRDFAPEHVQHRRFAPTQRVAEIQVERPIPAQLGTSFGLDGGAGFGIAMDTRSEPVCALPGHLPVNRERAINVIAATIERHRTGAFNIA